MDNVDLRPHDPAWTASFEAERDRIRDLAGETLLGVFHVGSTAVPDLPAKPVVDVLGVAPDEAGVRAARDALRSRFDLRREAPERTVLARGESTPPTFVHLRPRSADGWEEQLVFRDLLRADAEARAMYEGAKRAAAAAFPGDVDAYTDAKAPVVQLLTERAYEAGYDDGIPALSGDG